MVEDTEEITTDFWDGRASGSTISPTSLPGIRTVYVPPRDGAERFVFFVLGIVMGFGIFTMVAIVQ